MQKTRRQTLAQVLRRKRRRKKPTVFHEVHRRINYRLLPEKKSVWGALSTILENDRRLYNRMRRYYIDTWVKTKTLPTPRAAQDILTEWRKEPELKKGSVHMQRGTVGRVDQAFQDWERNNIKAAKKAAKKGETAKTRKFPKYREKKDFQSIVIMDKNGFDVRGEWLRIAKLGLVRIRRKGGNPYAQGSPCNVTLVKKYGKWYVSIVYKVLVPVPRNNGSILGVDRNVKQVVDSEGRFYRMPDIKRLEAKQKRYERNAARCLKGSNRQRRIYNKIAKIKGRIASIRHNHNHHVSKEFAKRAGTIILEKLNTKGMMKSAKGTKESPGKNVKAKTGLNWGIQSSNWFQLERMIGYKAHKVLYIEPAYTSQTCYVCGHRSKKSRKSQAIFECVECGHSANADINAALNIRRLGLAHLHGEGRSR